MPSWSQVLVGVANAWREQRDGDRGAAASGSCRAWRAPRALPPAEGEHRPGHARRRGRRRCGAATTREHGGFSRGAPKFPAASAIEFLLRRGERADGAAHAARDGERRHVRPGRRRLLALLGRRPLGRSRTSRRCSTTTRCSRARTCTASRCRASRSSRACARETLDWALRDLRQEEGGFASALDADSEGEEGKFYVWTPDEVRDGAGRRALADAAIAHFGLDRPANFEGRWASPCARRATRRGCAEIKARLRAAREQRVWPALDDKRLAAWNALMISALADAGAALEREDYTRRPRSPAPSSSGATCATPTGGCCAPTTAARPGSAPTSRTTRSCSRRC